MESSLISITHEYVLGNSCDLSHSILSKYGVTEDSNFRISFDDISKLYHIHVTNKYSNIHDDIKINSPKKNTKYTVALSVNDWRKITTFNKNGKITHVSKATIYKAIRNGEFGELINKRIKVDAFFEWYKKQCNTLCRYEKARKLYTSGKYENIVVN